MAAPDLSQLTSVARTTSQHGISTTTIGGRVRRGTPDRHRQRHRRVAAV